VYVILQVIKNGENTDMADTCRIVFNNLYDTCIYEESNKLMQRKLNCSFRLQLNNSEKTISEVLDECKISDMARTSNVNTFHNMLSNFKQGDILNLKNVY
jgi:hypothetical protein